MRRKKYLFCNVVAIDKNHSDCPAAIDMTSFARRHNVRSNFQKVNSHVSAIRKYIGRLKLFVEQQQ